MKADASLLLARTGEAFEWRRWCREIPAIHFDAGWAVQVIPPFGTGVARFVVLSGDAGVSVYLDCYDMAGFMGRPYWEVYPHDGDVFRCDMGETDLLLQAIRESIAEQGSGDADV